MEIKIIDIDFSVCKISSAEGIGLPGEFVFFAKTDDEISLVCETASVPENALAAEHGFRAMKIQGVLDFSLIGILSKIAAILADGGIGIFVVSTYNTDYILVKEDKLAEAARLLEENGYSIV
ncbi:MAG: ACT domain-containing protein [Christensenellaceae bacterium]|jgi:hypothetical protein